MQLVSGAVLNQVVQTVAVPAGISPVVVVGPGTEGVEFRTASIGNDRVVAIGEVINRTLAQVECSLEVLSAYGQFVVLRLSDVHLSVDGQCGALLCRLHRQLFFGLHISCFSPGRVVFLREGEVEQIFLSRVEAVAQPLDGNQFVGAWCHAAQLDGTGPGRLSISGQSVGKGQP